MTMKTKNNRINFIGGYQPKDDTPVTPPPAVKPAHEPFFGIRRCEKYVPKTNADRIRSMTDEELAGLFNSRIWSCEKGFDCPAEKHCNFHNCKETLLEWLKAPAEGLEESNGLTD